MSPGGTPFHGLPARVVVANYPYFTKLAPPGVTEQRVYALHSECQRLRMMSMLANSEDSLDEVIYRQRSLFTEQK